MREIKLSNIVFSKDYPFNPLKYGSHPAYVLPPRQSFFRRSHLQTSIWLFDSGPAYIVINAWPNLHLISFINLWLLCIMRVQTFDKIYRGSRTQLQIIYADYAQLYSKMVYLFNYGCTLCNACYKTYLCIFYWTEMNRRGVAIKNKEWFFYSARGSTDASITCDVCNELPVI